MEKIKAGIIGSTGYSGAELIRLLLDHPYVEITHATSKSYVGKAFNQIYENFSEISDMECVEEDIAAMSEETDVIFIALPHGIASAKVTESILQNTKIIDIGADFRLKDVNAYEQWYKTEHHGKELLNKAIYGLCEWNRENIKNAKLIANPGCYATCSILTLAPLLKDLPVKKDSIVIDAKSGVTGAGRTLNISSHYNECNESIKAYKLASHRHTPEIEQCLREICGEEIILTFTPHLIPMNRGILVTAYAQLNENLSYADIKNVYEKYYKDEHFIRLTKENIYPETRWVKGSNYCDIGFVIDERTNRIILTGAIDNLIKGASGQAVQNMNLLFDLPEKTGLGNIPVFPI